MSRDRDVLHTFHHEGKRYVFIYDTLHETRGSYAYDTPEDTKAAEDEEIEKLDSGEWVVLGILVSKPCEGVLPLRPSCDCGLASYRAVPDHDPRLDSADHSESCASRKVQGIHCECCKEQQREDGHSYIAEDSLWGVVIENDSTAWEKFVTDGGI